MRVDAVCVEDWNAEFADGIRGEADAFGDAGEEWKECGFPEALVVDGGVPVLAADFDDGLADVC
jgi:hypothetical protein